MKRVRRVTARDVQAAGSLRALIQKLVAELRNAPMVTKEHAAALLDSLSKQGTGLDAKQTEENAVLIARAGAIPPLVSLVSTGSTIAQVHACGTLATIADGQPDFQAHIFEAGGVPALVHALRKGDAMTQQLAVFALASVSQLRLSQEAIVKAPGAVAALVALLNGGVSDEAAVRACLTLANLSDQNAEGQALIARAGAIPLLVGLLAGGKALEAVATILARLALGHTANRKELVQLGGIALLVALLSAINVPTQARAASALASLTRGDNQDEPRSTPSLDEVYAKELRLEIAKAGGLPALLALIECRDLDLQRSTVNALGMLVTNCPDNQEAIASMGGITPLVALCSASTPPEVQAQAVFALTELSRHREENQTAIAETGAIALLSSLMRSTSAVTVKLEIAGAFWALSENHPRNKISIASSGAIALIVDLLGATAERAPTLAAHALSSLALGNTDNQGEIAKLLVNLLLSAKHPDAQEKASNTLWRIIRENPGDEFVIASAGGAGSLVRLMRDAKLESVRAYALLSLSLAIDETNQEVVAEEGGIEPLVGLLSLSDATTREQAARALQRLALNNSNTQKHIAKQGAVEPLIALLDSDKDLTDRSQEYAAAALSQIGGIRLGKTAICRGGGITPLVNLLCDRHRQAESKQYAAAALSRLAQETARKKTPGERKCEKKIEAVRRVKT